jgi:hypothetical protein
MLVPLRQGVLLKAVFVRQDRLKAEALIAD